MTSQSATIATNSNELITKPIVEKPKTPFDDDDFIKFMTDAVIYFFKSDYSEVNTSILNILANFGED
jgi:hypothetical protein